MDEECAIAKDGENAPRLMPPALLRTDDAKAGAPSVARPNAQLVAKAILSSGFQGSSFVSHGHEV